MQFPVNLNLHGRPVLVVGGGRIALRKVEQLLMADAEVTAALSPDQIEEKFDLAYHTKHVETIFKRVFGT